ncbi:HDOD domain-containing protein [Parasulfuritortus cantonensis]|uniref:HDOD domain-containing protein n=1 Tax=Parasulfuritortus cantonensis TaxID=2528202 RepID=A0A4R1B5S3_9PROT|nr:HDOD domain-containing protein [Parasulfuritortus cantonensis]TCJ11867.1 HDOD domain-containing protein [Parasulfuritortus cantonensis]
MFDEVASRLLSQIARELSGSDVVFPTSFELTLHVQALLKNPDTTIDKLAEMVQAEPLMSTRVLAYANSVAVRGSGPEITELNRAIMRIGLDAVRTISYTLSVEQLIRSKHMQPLQPIANAIWEHSLGVAALARLLARRQRMNAEKAFFLGIVHDIGAFYLLFRCSQDPVLAADGTELVRLVFQWHDGIGHALLSAMGQPEDVLTAVQDHEAPTTVESMNTWTAILTCADCLGQQLSDWVPDDLRAAGQRTVSTKVIDAEEQAVIVAMARDDLAALHSALF